MSSKMSEYNIELLKAYGVETNSTSCFCFLNDEHLLYLVGANLITLELHWQKSNITPIKIRNKIEFMNVTSDQTYLSLIDMNKRDSFLSILDLKSTNYKVKR